MTKLFRAAVICTTLAFPAGAAAQSSPPASDDPLRHGAARGAAIGAAGMIGFASVSVGWCTLGCEADGSVLALAVPGALVGALAGWIADRDAGKTRQDGQGVRARIGPALRQTWYRSSSLDGAFSSPGLSATLQPSPHVIFTVEYHRARATLLPAPGSVRQSVLANTVPATSRAAGWSQGLVDRRFGGSLTEMVGGRLPSWGPMTIELLGGVTVHQQESTDYYDAWAPGGPVTGKYYALTFKAPEAGWIYGSNIEVAVGRNLMVIPGVRVTHLRNARMISAGAGLAWKF